MAEADYQEKEQLQEVVPDPAPAQPPSKKAAAKPPPKQARTEPPTLETLKAYLRPTSTLDLIKDGAQWEFAYYVITNGGAVRGKMRKDDAEKLKTYAEEHKAAMAALAA